MGNSFSAYYNGCCGVLLRNQRRRKLQREAEAAAKLLPVDEIKDAMDQIMDSIDIISQKEARTEQAKVTIDGAYKILRKKKFVAVTSEEQVRALGYLKRNYAWNGYAVLCGVCINQVRKLRAVAHEHDLRSVDLVVAQVAAAAV